MRAVEICDCLVRLIFVACAGIFTPCETGLSVIPEHIGLDTSVWPTGRAQEPVVGEARAEGSVGIGLDNRSIVSGNVLNLGVLALREEMAFDEGRELVEDVLPAPDLRLALAYIPYQELISSMPQYQGPAS